MKFNDGEKSVSDTIHMRHNTCAAPQTHEVTGEQEAGGTACAKPHLKEELKETSHGESEGVTLLREDVPSRFWRVRSLQWTQRRLMSSAIGRGAYEVSS